MKVLGRFLAGVVAAVMLPVAVHAADDPFLGTWRLNKAKSIIASDPGVKNKEFVFAPSADGVMITESLEMNGDDGKPHVSHIPYAYGKNTPQTGAGFDALLVARADPHSVIWTVQGKGQVLSQLQVNVSGDGRLMTFRYLWNAADPDGNAFNDRYVYEKQ